MKKYIKIPCLELKNRGLQVEIQKPVKVYYSDQLVGEYFADLVVEGKVIIEIKSVENLNSLFEAQLLNYLKATGLTVGLIINFGPSVQVKRMVL